MIEAAGRESFAIRGDVGVESDIVSMWSEAVARFGTIHALVNNAGILEQQMPLVEYSVERLQRIFNVNVIGSMLCAREAIKHMSTKRGGAGGSIINLSSVAARLGAPNEYVDYAASKGTIDTEIHASGGEPNRVARVAERIPLKRGGTPQEIAEGIVWLISDQASYVTGTVLDVTGGL